MDIRVTARIFNEHYDAYAPAVALVDRRVARTIGPGESAVAKRLREPEGLRGQRASLIGDVGPHGAGYLHGGGRIGSILGLAVWSGSGATGVLIMVAEATSYKPAGAGEGEPRHNAEIRVAHPMKTLLVATLDEWQTWLEDHHASESEVWLIFHKRHTGVASIDYKDALDEALCFGWVDSLVKRLDDERYARKFTPRREDSRWSAVNRKRYAELKASGRLKPAGIARAPTERGYDPRPPRFALPSTLPPYIETALKENPAALRHFEALTPSQRRRYLGWIDSAKREETKQRRLAEAIRLLAAGKELGLK